MITRHEVASHASPTVAPRTHHAIDTRVLPALALALLTTAIALTGCGGSGSSASRNSTSAQSDPSGSNQAALASGPVVPASAPASQVPSPLTAQPKQAESMPPDIEVLAIDSLVTPGQGLLLTVLGTPDVSEVALADGSGDTQYFYKDPTSNTWRVQYRVPLRSKGERIALSVMAKNDDQRWRRRWVFLTLRREQPSEVPASVEPDAEGEEGCAPQS